MHQNPAFRSQDPARDVIFARERAFGILTMNGPDVPVLAHVPFLLSEDGGMADLHLMRSNPIARMLDGAQPAAIAISGPDGYVSPDWYGIGDQVPTWNYVAVHLRGTLERLPDEELRGILDRQSQAYESALAPKPVWMPEKMSDDALERMMRAIVPCRFQVLEISATWKLGQNKPSDARLRAADAVGKFDVGMETDLLSELMETPPEV